MAGVLDDLESSGGAPKDSPKQPKPPRARIPKAASGSKKKSTATAPKPGRKAKPKIDEEVSNLVSTGGAALAGFAYMRGIAAVAQKNAQAVVTAEAMMFDGAWLRYKSDDVGRAVKDIAELHPRLQEAIETALQGGKHASPVLTLLGTIVPIIVAHGILPPVVAQPIIPDEFDIPLPTGDGSLFMVVDDETEE